ncbi:MAG: segregation/condensation protein A [Patescibacteria group bacterium]|nr:segregation/condensation protein A [Patescibacteria group bacterium]MBU1870716.1 segregation/condensation protein A [Patescibacteria group bacterium]
MHIKINKFEGPLSLLLQLIEKEEMDITEISLAKIADQYIEYIKNFPGIRPDEIADFLVVAAKLLLIKSKILLPYLCSEEKVEIEEFERQLRIYKEFLEASKVIEAMINKKQFTFTREFNKQAILANVYTFSPPKNLSLEILKTTFQELIAKIYLPEQLEEKKLEYTISIEEKILAIQQILIDKIKISFNKTLINAQNKMDTIVSFLAMLELIKQRNIIVVQCGLFSEIEIMTM